MIRYTNLASYGVKHPLTHSLSGWKTSSRSTVTAVTADEKNPTLCRKKYSCNSHDYNHHYHHHNTNKKNYKEDYVRVAKVIKSNNRTLLKTAEEAHRSAECLLRSQ